MLNRRVSSAALRSHEAMREALVPPFSTYQMRMPRSSALAQDSLEFFPPVGLGLATLLCWRCTDLLRRAGLVLRADSIGLRAAATVIRETAAHILARSYTINTTNLWMARALCSTRRRF